MKDLKTSSTLARLCLINSRVLISLVSGTTMSAALFTAAIEPALAERYNIDRDYKGPLCLNLGHFTGQRTISIEWGSWVGQKTINGDPINEQRVSFSANGNNVTDMEISGANGTQPQQRSCGPTLIKDGLYNVHTLDWYRR